MDKYDGKSVFSRERKRHKDMQLIKENLLDGRIYHFTDGTVFVETDCNFKTDEYLEAMGYIMSLRVNH